MLILIKELTMKRFILILVVLVMALFVSISSSAEIRLEPIEGTIWEYRMTDVVGIFPPSYKHLSPEESLPFYYLFLDDLVYLYRGQEIWQPFPQVEDTWAYYWDSFSIMHQHMSFEQGGIEQFTWGTVFSFHSIGTAIEPMGVNIFLYISFFEIKYYADIGIETQIVTPRLDSAEMKILPEGDFISLPY